MKVNANTNSVNDIIDYLSTTDTDNRKTRAEIAAATGYSDREIRAAIQRARMQGCPIVSDTGRGGYFIARTPEEITPLLRDLNSRANAIHKVVEALSEQQMELEKERGSYYAS